MKLKPKSYFTLFYILFFAVVIIGSLGYTRKARLIPLVVAIPCLGMSIAQFFIDLRKGKKKGRSIEDDLFHGVMEKVIHQEVVTEGEKEEEKTGMEKTKAFFKIIGWILIFYLSIFLFGFLIAIPLFTILFMRFERERWFLSAACAAGLWLTIYLSFSVAAKISLYDGLVFQLLSGGE
jgi:hypothetical protein